jgi:hypothetical protein
MMMNAFTGAEIEFLKGQGGDQEVPRCSAPAESGMAVLAALTAHP